MKILADEGIDAAIVDRMRQEGHEVIYVAELDPGVDDGSILDLARREGALLLTFDKDFGELIFRQRRAPSGVLLLRLAGLAAESKAELVTSTLSDHEKELIGAFSVLARSSSSLPQWSVSYMGRPGEGGLSAAVAGGRRLPPRWRPSYAPTRLGRSLVGLPRLLSKGAQGVGRGIRQATRTGFVCRH